MRLRGARLAHQRKSEGPALETANEVRREVAGEANGAVRFVSDLSADLVHDLRGKTLTLTLVSEAGASEAQWTFPR